MQLLCEVNVFILQLLCKVRVFILQLLLAVHYFTLSTVSVFTLQLFVTGEVEVTEFVGHHDLAGVLVHRNPAQVL